MTELAALRTEGVLGKLTLLRGHKRLAHGYEALEIPTMTIGGLFLESNLSQAQVVTPKKERPANRASRSLSSAGTSVPEEIGPVAPTYSVGVTSQNGRGWDHLKVRSCLAVDFEVRCLS